MTVCLDVAIARTCQSVPVSFYGGEQAIFAKSERAHATALIPVYMRGLAIDPGEYGQVWYVDVPLQVYSTPRFVLQTAVCPYEASTMRLSATRTEGGHMAISVIALWVAVTFVTVSQRGWVWRGN